MANRKITEFSALTQPANDDVLPIVDISESLDVDKNKKITVAEMFKSIPSGSAAAPGLAFEGADTNGIYYAGSNTVGIGTNGVSRVTVSASGVVSSLPISANSFIPTSSTVPTNGLYLPSANNVAVSTNGTGRLFVDASGNVGISTAPDVRFALGDFTSNEAIRIRQTANGYGTIYFANGSSGANLYQGFIEYGAGTAGDFMRFGTAQNERLRITSTGQIQSAGLGSAASPALSFTTDTNTGIYSPGADQLAISTNGTGRLFVDASGNVGLGTTPVAPFDVKVATDARLLFQDGNTANNVKLNAVNNAVSANTNLEIASANTLFFNGGSERLRITSTGQLSHIGAGSSSTPAVSFSGSAPVNSLVVDSSGRCGIGTSSPGTVLHCAINSSATSIAAAPGTAFFQNLNATSGAINNLLFANSGGFGSAAIYTTQTQTGNSGDNLVLNTKTSGGAWNTGVVIDTAGRLGIGTTSPSYALHVVGTINSSDANIGFRTALTNGLFQAREFGGSSANNTLEFNIRPDSGKSGYLTFTETSVADRWSIGIQNGSDGLRFISGTPTTGTERCRIDGSGRLLVGTSTARNVAGITSQLQIEGTTYDSSSFSLTANSNDNQSSYLVFGKSRGTSVGSNTIVQDGDQLGYIAFAGTDGSTNSRSAAAISAFVDATPGSLDMPGRLVFSTTADGASSPTERLRITSTGTVNIVGAGTAGSTQAISFNGSAPVNSLVVDSSGRCGIGSSSPSYTLDVSTNIRAFTSSFKGGGASANMLFAVGGNAGELTVPVAEIRGYDRYSARNVFDGDLAIHTVTGNSSTEKVRIDYLGRVGIGTTSPATTVHAVGTVRISRSDDANQYLNLYSSLGEGFIDAVNSNSATNQPIIFRIGNNSTTTERARIDSSGRLLVGTSSVSHTTTVVVQGNTSSSTDAGYLSLRRGETATSITTGEALGVIDFRDSDGNRYAEIYAQADAAAGSNDYPGRLVFSTTADGASSPTERMRIINNGSILIGKTVDNNSDQGINIGTTGFLSAVRVGGPPIYVNRLVDDGVLVEFAQDSIIEGTISVSGTTVSYNGAHLSRWSQLPSGAERTEILRGSVLSNIDEMCEWGDEDNEQLNRMKMSDVEGDKNVSGVFQAWDDDDDTYTNDFYCAMTGDFIIRIGAGVTVERGDLLMSAGDGTAKPQDDDIIRSKTIAKVTSTNVTCTYEDGSYCVPCVLMAC